MAGKCFRHSLPLYVLICSAAVSAQANSGYRMLDLGTCAGPNGRAAATDVNERGQAVGFCETAAGETRAFIWNRGVMTALGTLGGSFSAAYGINNRGQVVGSSTNAAGQGRAFVWDSGVMTDLGALASGLSTALAINDRGQIAGYSYSSPFGPYYPHAILWEGGRMTDLGPLAAPFLSTVATGINNAGQVTGYSDPDPLGGGLVLRSFIWERGTMRDLGTLGQGSASVNDINDSGQLVGSFAPPEVDLYRPFIWDRGGLTEVMRPGPQPLVMGSAQGINNKGQVVGYHFGPPSSVPNAFVWENGTFIELGTFGGVFSTARRINDSGIIAGSSTNAAGIERAFLAYRSKQRDAAVPPTGGMVEDDLFGPSASVRIPGNALRGVTNISIDVVAPPHNVITPAGFAFATHMMELDVAPLPSSSFPAPGATVVLPLSASMRPGTSLMLLRLDPIAGLVPAQTATGAPVSGVVDASGDTATFAEVSRLSSMIGAIASALPGDVDSNGRVDCGDLAIVRASFGKRTGQPGYDTRADVNRDGIVNGVDLALVSRQLPVGVACAN